MPLDPTQMKASEAETRNARRHGRVRCEYLLCCHGRTKFGHVVDLSASGMRVVRKGWVKVQDDDQLHVTLKWQNVLISVSARVVWVKKIGYRKHLIGFTFPDLSPSATAEINHIAHLATDSLTVAAAQIEASRAGE